MNTNILRLIAESQKESINEKKLAKARQLCKEVEELCKKYDMSFFFVTEGASITRNKGNDAVRNARQALADGDHIKELENKGYVIVELPEDLIK